jgi:biopolymer transport protein ExbD
MSATFKRGVTSIQANLTPMIDVTFLLIVFFVLVSQIVEVENVEMELPRPRDAATVLAGDEQRVVINVVPSGSERGGVGAYRVGAAEFGPGDDGLSAMSAHITGLYRDNPGLRVNLRADRTTRYEHVEPAMAAVSTAARSAGVPSARINLVVVKEDERR